MSMNGVTCKQCGVLGLEPDIFGSFRDIAFRVEGEFLCRACVIANEYEPCTCPPLPWDRDPHCRRHPALKVQK